MWVGRSENGLVHARFHVAKWETKEKIFQTCDITTTIILSLIRFRLKRNPNCVTANCSCRGRRRQAWRGRRRGEPGLALFKLGRRRLCCATHCLPHTPVSTHRHAVPRGGHPGTFLASAAPVAGRRVLLVHVWYVALLVDASPTVLALWCCVFSVLCYLIGWVSCPSAWGRLFPLRCGAPGAWWGAPELALWRGPMKPMTLDPRLGVWRLGFIGPTPPQGPARLLPTSCPVAPWAR